MSKSKSSQKKEPLIMNRLAVVMKEEKITNRALAAKIGYEETTVSKWVTNTVQPPIFTFYRIALILKRNLQELFVSTKNISDEDMTEQLILLESMAEKAKKTGRMKNKV